MQLKADRALSVHALPLEACTAIAACSLRPLGVFSRSSESLTKSQLALVVPVIPGVVVWAETLRRGFVQTFAINTLLHPCTALKGAVL